MITSYSKLAPEYLKNFSAMKLRTTGAYAADLKETVEEIMEHKSIYQACAKLTGIPWWWFPPAHYREASLDFNAYFGNGQRLDRPTTEVPAHRGPFKTFSAGVVDAVRLQGYLGATDWSFPRAAYRWNAFNGFGYTECLSPYLYAGTTLYGPPEARGGLFVADHVFSSHVLDKRLGCFAIMRGMMDVDSTIRPIMAIGGTVPQTDDIQVSIIKWVQQRLNALHVASPPLVVDGILGSKTMKAVSVVQGQHGQQRTGLPDQALIDVLNASPAPMPTTPEPTPVVEAPPPRPAIPVVAPVPPAIPVPPPHRSLPQEIAAFLDALFHPHPSDA